MTDDAHAANPTSRSLLAERDTLIQHGDMCDHLRRCAISSGTLLRSSMLTPTATPDRRRQARAPLVKDAEGVGVPLILSLVIVLADPEPPKASAGIPR
ncbi:hypothetical protein GGF50DRAFT_121370 [Schizophyllum commune]